MKAMVLAAGRGTRLSPLTGEVPKPMAPVVDKPILQHIFELLSRSGVKEAYANVHHLAEVILEFFGEKARVDGMPVSFTREEELMGTAGGVRRLADRFDGTFVVIMGDALTDVDLGEVVGFHEAHGALATVALARVDDTSQYGVVELDEEGNILSFQEKPNSDEAVSNLANTGIYVLEPEVLRMIPRGVFSDFARDVFPHLLEVGAKFVGYEGSFYWSDIGTLESYRAAQQDVLGGRVKVRIPGTPKAKNLWTGRNARLHPTATFEGGVLVGRDAVVGPRAELIGDTTIGSGCWISPGATVKRSILMPEACVGTGAYLEDCIIGHGYQVRPGDRIRSGTLLRGAG